jgi:hypothetical protein
MKRRSKIPPGSPFDRSIAGFCLRNGISRATYVKLHLRGDGPDELIYSTRKTVITVASEAAWHERFTNPTDPEDQKQRKAILDFRRKRAVVASASAVKSPGHSKQQKIKRLAKEQAQSSRRRSQRPEARP